MKDRDRQLATDYDKQSIIPGIRLIMAIALQVKKTIVDYGLGAAILGVLPLYGSWIPPIRIILLIALNLKMASNIARSWGYHRGQSWAEIISCIFGLISSVILALIAWLGVLLLAIWIPFIDILARSVAYGILTVNIGRTISHYYSSPQTLDTKALQRALKFFRSSGK